MSKATEKVSEKSKNITDNFNHLERQVKEQSTDLFHLTHRNEKAGTLLKRALEFAKNSSDADDDYSVCGKLIWDIEDYFYS